MTICKFVYIFTANNKINATKFAMFCEKALILVQIQQNSDFSPHTNLKGLVNPQNVITK